MILYINDNPHVLNPLNFDVTYVEDSGEQLINTITIMDLDAEYLHFYSTASITLINGLSLEVTLSIYLVYIPSVFLGIIMYTDCLVTGQFCTRTY